MIADLGTMTVRRQTTQGEPDNKMVTPPSKTSDPTVNRSHQRFGWKRDPFPPCQRSGIPTKKSCANQFTIDCLLWKSPEQTAVWSLAVRCRGSRRDRRCSAFSLGIGLFRMNDCATFGPVALAAAFGVISHPIRRIFGFTSPWFCLEHDVCFLGWCLCRPFYLLGCQGGC